jgi:hypothetical protein
MDMTLFSDTWGTATYATVPEAQAFYRDHVDVVRLHCDLYPMRDRRMVPEGMRNAMRSLPSLMVDGPGTHNHIVKAGEIHGKKLLLVPEWNGIRNSDGYIGYPGVYHRFYPWPDIAPPWDDKKLAKLVDLIVLMYETYEPWGIQLGNEVFPKPGSDQVGPTETEYHTLMLDVYSVLPAEVQIIHDPIPGASGASLTSRHVFPPPGMETDEVLDLIQRNNGPRTSWDEWVLGRGGWNPWTAMGENRFRAMWQQFMAGNPPLVALWVWGHAPARWEWGEGSGSWWEMGMYATDRGVSRSAKWLEEQLTMPDEEKAYTATEVLAILGDIRHRAVTTREDAQQAVDSAKAVVRRFDRWRRKVADDQ